MTPHLVVAGSLNMDFVVSVDRLPGPGETVLGSNFRMVPGGKGANQACAAGKLGASRVLTKMAGRVGYDVFADHLKASLAAAGVDVSAVHATNSQPTGVALICVDRSGENSIVVASGANHELTPSDVQGLRKVFQGASYALFQLESPIPAVAAALKLAREEGVKTILDPAPATPAIIEHLSLVDVVTPNETEAQLLLGRQPARISRKDAPELARELRKSGVTAVILKLGEQGAFYSGPDAEIWAAAFAVKAVDTTAAGDTFNGALAVALAESRSMAEALRFANAAGALSVTRAGAQSSIPSRAEVDDFLSARPVE